MLSHLFILMNVFLVSRNNSLEFYLANMHQISKCMAKQNN